MTLPYDDEELTDFLNAWSLGYLEEDDEDPYGHEDDSDLNAGCWSYNW